MEELYQRKKVLILFFIALFIRIAFVLSLKNRFYFDDEFEYYRIVQNFLSCNGFMAGEGMKGFRPPLYPLFLSIFYLLRFNLFGIRIVQCIISAITVVFVYLTGKKLFSERTGLWSGIIASVYPFFIFYNGFLLTETLFIFLTVIAPLHLLEPVYHWVWQDSADLQCNYIYLYHLSTSPAEKKNGL